MPAVENMVFGGQRQWPNGFGGQKPSGRRGFWLWTSLSRASQSAAGMLRPLRLAQSQNPQPQQHSQFSDRLSDRLSGAAFKKFVCGAFLLLALMLPALMFPP